MQLPIDEIRELEAEFNNDITLVPEDNEKLQEIRRLVQSNSTLVK